MKEAPATDADRAALDTVKKLGMVPVEVSIPDWPYDSLDLILFSEGAAAFEELVLSDQVSQLKAQVPDAWPNLFAWRAFLSAVDFVQADRFRRQVAAEMARLFAGGSAVAPLLRDEMLTISNPHWAPLAYPARGVRSRWPRRGAIGRPIPRPIHCPPSLLRAAFPMALPFWDGCLRRDGKPDWRWSVPLG